MDSLIEGDYSAMYIYACIYWPAMLCLHLQMNKVLGVWRKNHFFEDGALKLINEVCFLLAAGMLPAVWLRTCNPAAWNCQRVSDHCSSCFIP